MSLSFLDVVKYCAEWYTSGIILSFICMLYSINISKTLDEVKVHNVQELFMLALAGPLMILFMLCWLFFELFGKLKKELSQHKDVVLWRSRRGKTKTVLYGNKDEDDD